MSGGVLLLGLAAAFLFTRGRGGGEASSTAPAPPSAPRRYTYTAADLMAAARMIASENPTASEDVWVEQIHSQLRSLGPLQSLHDRITGGKGYGPQGGSRPVTTVREPRPAHLRVAREVLEGQRPSKLDGARKFFNPREEDAVYDQVHKGKEDLAAGRPVSARTKELMALGYQRTAQDVRDKWQGEGKHLVGTVGPLEFWT